jgi:hypothetical protein
MELNKRLSSVRYIIEQAFGVCKAQFRLLNRPLECAREEIIKATYLITAILVVHNFLIEEDDDTVIEVRASNQEVNPLDGDASFPNSEDRDDFQGIKTRDILLRHIYWKLYP